MPFWSVKTLVKLDKYILLMMKDEIEDDYNEGSPRLLNSLKVSLGEEA